MNVRADSHQPSGADDGSQVTFVGNLLMPWLLVLVTRPLPEMLAFFFAFLKDLALEFAFSHFSGFFTKNRIFRQLSQLPILFLCGSTYFGWHSYL